ncbi:MAG: glycosyltransferase [Thermoanaerobaculia bacterium]|nr:glycosyltransferase [Thermoanaerobaculia bacterium]
MRLLALDLGAGLRGGQKQTALLLAELARRGHAIRFIGRRAAPLSACLRNRGIDVVEAPPGPEASPGLLLAVARTARRFQPDLLYAGDSRGHGAAVWSRASAGRPLIVHRRVVFRPSGHPLSRVKYRAADRFLAVSEAVAATLAEAGVDASRVAVVPDGLPPEAFVSVPAPPAPPHRLVHVGAFDGGKGQDIAVETLARLVLRGHDATLLLLGSGPQQAAVAARAGALGVAERCDFAGEVGDVSTRLAASHLLLLPSESEGAPLALVEAMAAGCPVLAHAVGGIPELVAHGKVGRLVSSLSPEAWEAAVSELLEDAGERLRLIRAGRATAATRTLSRTVALVEAELEKALAGAGNTS